MAGHTDGDLAGGRTEEKAETDSNGHKRVKKDNPFGDREGKELHIGKKNAKSKKNRGVFDSSSNAAEAALSLGRK